jgi:phosphoserine phosphatase RsbU/P
MAVAYLQDHPAPSILCSREAQSMPCAGDVIDVFTCADEQANIVMADVCGRDAQAREYACYLRYVVRMLSDERSPASLLARASMAYYRNIEGDGEERFASLFLATLQGRRLTYASAGHDVALLMKPNGLHRHLPQTGAVLGINPVEFYQEKTLAVERGDWLILVTDGISEARNRRGGFFGTSGIVRQAQAAIAAGFDDPAARIFDAARRHGGSRFVDDASVLCIRIS